MRWSSQTVRSAALAVQILWLALAPTGLRAAEDGCDQATGCLRGRPLIEGLEALQESGLPIVFSSALVRPEMTIVEEPRASRPTRRLAEILAPFDLTVRDLADGTLLVVAAQGAEHLAIRGRVSSGHTRRPLGGTRLVIRSAKDAGSDTQVATLPNGAFEVRGLEPGRYTLTATHPGHSAFEAQNLDVVADRTLDLPIELRPLPLVEDEILIRASEITVLQREPSGPLTLDRAEIERVPHLGNDPLRALALAPGVASDDRSAQLRLRGGRADELLTSLDGQELYRPYHLPDFGDALGLVSGDDLSNARLTTGGSPSSVGDRMGGTLDLRTREAGKAPRSSLSASFLNLHGSTSGRSGRRGWLVSARRGLVDLSSRVAGQERPEFWNVLGRLDQDLGPSSRLTGHLLRAADRLAFRETDGEESSSFDTSYDSTYLWATLSSVVGRSLLAETTLSSTTLDRDRRGLENEEEQRFAVSDVRRSDVTRLSQSWSLHLPVGHDLEWGVSGTRFETDFDYTSDVERDLELRSPFVAPAERTTLFRETLESDHLAGWWNDRMSLGERLTLELGARFDRYSLTDEEIWSPRISAAYLLDKGVLRASWGRFVQSQRPYELGVEDGQTSLGRAERSRQLSVGYERSFEETGGLEAFRAELYSRRVSHPRTEFLSLFEPNNVFPEMEIDRGRLTAERSERHGLELLLRGSVGDAVGWWVSGTLSEAEDRLERLDRPGTFVDVARRTDQPWSLQGWIHFRLPREVDLSFALHWHRGWPTTPVGLGRSVDDEGEEELFLELGDLHSERLRDVHRLDLRLSRSFTLRRGRLQVFLDVQNVYDRDNVAGFDISIDEDTEQLLVETETWYGILPSAGVRFSF